MNQSKWIMVVATGLMAVAGLNRSAAGDSPKSDAASFDSAKSDSAKSDGAKPDDAKPDDVGSNGAAAAPQVSIGQLSFLSGVWSGTFPGGRWESAYTTPDGGMIVSASKEFRGDRVVMIEFEHFMTVEGEVVLTPYPFGKKSSVSFKLSEFDEAKKRVVFANPEHDFPNKLIYERTKPDELVIQVIGTMRGKEVNQTMTFARVADEG